MHKILFHTAEHQNIVKINDKTGIKLIKNNLIYHPLKYTWGICKLQWHNKVLKCIVPTRQKNRFMFIFFGNGDMEIPIPKI